MLSTIAGRSHYSGEGGLADKAVFNGPTGLAFDNSGRLYVADTMNHRIRRVERDGTIVSLNSVNGLPAEDPNDEWVWEPRSPSVTSANDVLFIYYYQRVCRITAAGKVDIMAWADIPAPAPTYTTAVDAKDRMYFSGDSEVRRVVGTSGETVAGSPYATGFTGDGGQARSAFLDHPTVVATAPDGSFFVFDSRNGRIRRVGADGVIRTFAGNPKGAAPAEGASALQISLPAISALAYYSGWLYFAGGCAVAAVDSTGTYRQVAGKPGECGNSGDGGLATAARFGEIGGLAIDGSGVVYVADTSYDRIRRLTLSGTLTAARGNFQEASPNRVLSPLVVEARDGMGKLSPNVAVSFIIESGAALLAAPSSTTATDGRATMNLTLGAAPGVVTVLASALGYTPIRFTLTASVPAATMAVVSAAGGEPKLAPGSIASVFGANLAPCTETATSGDLPTSMCGGRVSVLLAGKPVQLLFVSPGQINFLVPEDASSGGFEVETRSPAGAQTVRDVRIENHAPAVFAVPRFFGTHGGFPAVQTYPDYTLVDFYNPAHSGDVLIVYATGLGRSGRDGNLRLLDSPSVTLDGRSIDVLSAALSDFPGLGQVAVRMPASIESGMHSLQLCYGSDCSSPLALPAAERNSSYVAGWVFEDRTPLWGLGISVDGVASGRSAQGGAFLAPAKKGKAVIRLDGGGSYYHWQDTVTLADGVNFLRAVAAVNEPQISGDLYMIPRLDSPNTKWTYNRATFLANPQNTDPVTVWSAQGQPMTLLDYLLWENGDADCRQGKTYRWETLPIRIFIPRTDPQRAELVRRGISAWNTPATTFFQEVDSDPTVAGIGVKVEFAPYPADPAASGGYQANDRVACVRPLTSTISLNPAWPLVYGKSGYGPEGTIAHEEGHALGMMHHSPAPEQLMYTSDYTKVPLPLESRAAMVLYSLPNGTLLDKYQQ
jgi:uncharacterized protein (TIGR03437 family)